MKTASGYKSGASKTRPYAKAYCETRGCGWESVGATNSHREGKKHARENKHCVVVQLDHERIYNHEEK